MQVWVLFQFFVLAIRIFFVPFSFPVGGAICTENCQCCLKTIVFCDMCVLNWVNNGICDIFGSPILPPKNFTPLSWLHFTMYFTLTGLGQDGSLKALDSFLNHAKNLQFLSKKKVPVFCP